MLNGTRVHDISALMGKESIEDLDLIGTSIKDLSSLATMQGLENLRLNNTQVEDFSILDEFDKKDNYAFLKRTGGLLQGP